MKTFAILITIFIATPAWGWGGKCEEKYARILELTENVGSIQQLLLDVESGSLRVTGEVGLTQVTVVGEACASSQKLLDEIGMASKSDNDSIRIATQMPDYDSRKWGRSVAYLNLEVRLPERMAVTIEDTSGSLGVNNVASLSIDDNSGSIRVRNITGPVSIEDGSGSITLDEIQGDVVIDDGSGSINIRHVDGNVLIEEDGSGSIDIRDVGNNVVVEHDGSGGIRVAQVGGDFSVRHDGSGGIDYDDVAGVVDVPKNKKHWK